MDISNINFKKIDVQEFEKYYGQLRFDNQKLLKFIKSYLDYVWDTSKIKDEDINISEKDIIIIGLLLSEFSIESDYEHDSKYLEIYNKLYYISIKYFDTLINLGSLWSPVVDNNENSNKLHTELSSIPRRLWGGIRDPEYDPDDYSYGFNIEEPEPLAGFFIIYNNKLKRSIPLSKLITDIDKSWFFHNLNLFDQLELDTKMIQDIWDIDPDLLIDNLSSLINLNDETADKIINSNILGISSVFFNLKSFKNLSPSTTSKLLSFIKNRLLTLKHYNEEEFSWYEAEDYKTFLEYTIETLEILNSNLTSFENKETVLQFLNNFNINGFRIKDLSKYPNLINNLCLE